MPDITSPTRGTIRGTFQGVKESYACVHLIEYRESESAFPEP